MAREFPPLYIRDKAGKLVSWRVWSTSDLVCTEHGKVDGKKVVHRDRVKATNVGRANERLGEAQADFEAEAAFAKKLKEGYMESMTAAANAVVYLPMLAHPYAKNGKTRKVPWSDGVMCQPKLDGLRALSFIEVDHVRMVSRQGTEWEGLPHIKAALRAAFPPGSIVDGEVYIPGVPLQTLNSLIKRHQDESLGLGYHIYDAPFVDGGFEDRYAYLTSRNLAKPLHLVETHHTTSEADTLALERKFVAAGYEGLMVRLTGQSYEWNDRSYNLLKVKQFQDAEFEILDVPGREYFAPGAAASVMIVDKFVLKNDRNELTFESVPVGTMQQRAEWYRVRESLIGARATVRFYGRSVDGVPSYNPVVKAIRLFEDLPSESSQIWS